MVWLIQHDLDFEKARIIQHGLRAPFIDFGLPSSFLDEMTPPRVFKSHFPIHMLPDELNHKAKVVLKCIKVNLRYDLISTVLLRLSMWYGIRKICLSQCTFFIKPYLIMSTREHSRNGLRVLLEVRRFSTNGGHM